MGFISVKGDVGVGMKTILRYYLETVDSQLLNIIYLFNAAVSFPDLLKAIYKELRLELGTDGMVKSKPNCCENGDLPKSTNKFT